MAAFWNTAALIVGQALRMIGSLIMTRLLAPEMFGVMSIVVAVQVTISLFSDVGVRTAIVQSRSGDDPKFLNTAWTLDIIRGVLVWFFCVAAAAAIYLAHGAGLLAEGSAWSAPDLPMALAVATFSSVITGLQSTNLTTAQRNLQAKRLVMLDLTAQILGLVAMVVLSYMMRSIWGLVLGGLIAPMINTIGSHIWFSGIWNKLAWDRTSIREIIGMGRWILLSSITTVISSNLDKYILATYISAAELGVYSIALNLLIVVEMMGNRIVSAVALPSLSEFARDQKERFRDQLLRFRLLIDGWFLFAAGALCATAPLLVETLYDPRYHDAGYMLQVLSFGLFFTRYGIMNMAYIALDNASAMSAVNFIKLVSGAILMPMLFHLYGMPGILVAIAIHQLPSIVFVLWRNHQLGLNSWRHEIMVLPAWPIGYVIGYLARNWWLYLAG